MRADAALSFCCSSTGGRRTQAQEEPGRELTVIFFFFLIITTGLYSTPNLINPMMKIEATFATQGLPYSYTISEYHNN